MTRKGKWVGTLDKPAALAGLAAYKRFFDVGSRAQQDDGRGAPNPVRRLCPGQRRVDARAPAWFTCCVGDYKNRAAQFVMPSHTKGQPIPGFLGGSDLAVPVGANKAQAAAWIRAFTDNASMTALRAKGNIPNTTSLLGQQRERARGPQELVRPDREELGQRRERQRPPHDAVADPDREDHRSRRPRRVASDNITFTLNQR